MTGVKLRFLAGISLFFISFSQAVAHPHLFIDASVDFHFDAQRLIGIQVYWVFDEFFTAGIVQDFDTDRDGKFNESETTNIRENAFQNLENYNYFTFFESSNESGSAKEVLDFKASLTESGRLLYTFFVPFSLTIQKNEQPLTVSMYDDTFFADIQFPEDDYSQVISDGNLVYSLESGMNKNKTYSAYQANPFEVTIKFRRK